MTDKRVREIYNDNRAENRFMWFEWGWKWIFYV